MHPNVQPMNTVTNVQVKNLGNQRAAVSHSFQTGLPSFFALVPASLPVGRVHATFSQG